ncbi:MAG: hypothetical protein CVV50_06045, partial [Spirochaetae bacterium HGW-Spirochaetae-6]
MRPLAIDTEKCVQCGLCLTQCARDKIIQNASEIWVTPSNNCIACGHCYAICPQRAILPENEVLPPLRQDPGISPESLYRFFLNRRSHRKYQKRPIPENLLLELIEFGRIAPTGTNNQPVQFLILQSPEAIEQARKELMKVYGTFHKLVKNPLVRFLVSLFDKRIKKPELRRDLATMVSRFQKGEDPLFHHAPAVVFLLASKYESSTPADDCAYALSQMVFGAETLGLSACINGLA